MHMNGTPYSMQKNPVYTNVVDEVILFFKEKMVTLNQMGIDQVALDPGFGFGKDLDHNFELLKHMRRIEEDLNLPILAGISRKSLINKVLHTKPEEALNGTTALHMLALQNGAKILRAHDVKEANQTILLFEKYQSTK
jgi:dihydropteroate synthase